MERRWWTLSLISIAGALSEILLIAAILSLAVAALGFALTGSEDFVRQGGPEGAEPAPEPAPEPVRA